MARTRRPCPVCGAVKRHLEAGRKFRELIVGLAAGDYSIAEFNDATTRKER
jgi:hypothetical protein